MLKNYLRSTIIVLLQAIFPIFAILLIIPWVFSQSSPLMQLQHHLTQLKPWFIMLHGLFYLTFLTLWPTIVCHLQQHEVTGKQLKIVISVRWYLMATFVLIDLLMLWR